MPMFLKHMDIKQRIDVMTTTKSPMGSGKLMIAEVQRGVDI